MATKVQTAISSVDGFGQIYEKFVKQMQVQQYSCSSIRIYGSQIAAISLHFGKTPEKLTDDDFRDYLSFLQTGCSPSSFKHAVCCLRCYFPIMGLPLPSYSLPYVRLKLFLWSSLMMRYVAFYVLALIYAANFSLDWFTLAGFV